MSERQRVGPERPAAERQEREVPSERQRVGPERPAAERQEREVPSARQAPEPAVAVGTALPPLDVPVTRTLIIAGAIASRDFEPVHHDHLVAQERGSADVFTNILTTNGLVGRFVTDWAGPEARMTRIDIRLGAPAYPGDTLAFRGEVVEVQGRRATVEVRAASARGDHATGTVEVEWT